MRLSLALFGLLLICACSRRSAPRGCPPEPTPPVPVAVPAPVPESTPAVDPLPRAILLRGMRKEARWALAQREVGLRPEQVVRLREAVAARDASLAGKTGIITRVLERLPWTTVMGDDDEWCTFAYVGEIERADAELDERAKAILSPEQWVAWSGGGFSRAFGLRLPHVPQEEPALFRW